MKPKSTFKIRPDLCAEFEALPNPQGSRWTPEADEVILKYWKVKKHSDFVSAFSKRFFPLGERQLESRYWIIFHRQ